MWIWIHLDNVKSYFTVGFFMFLFALLYGFFLAEVQAIASMIEKQAQIVVKQKVSVESKKGKEAVLAQYGNVTDEEEYPWGCHFR